MVSHVFLAHVIPIYFLFLGVDSLPWLSICVITCPARKRRCRPLGRQAPMLCASCKENLQKNTKI